MGICSFLVSIVAAAAGDVPAVGAAVPDFKMADQAGRLVTAGSLAGKRYLLAFYPKDFTPG